MIYTSYFGNYKNFPTNCVAISITQYPPKGWKGLELRSLAPSVQLLNDYKQKAIDEYVFELRYLAQLNKDSNLRESIKAVLLELDKKYENVILCCYEKSGDFCHRHVLAQWLGGDGGLKVHIEEFGENGVTG